MCTRARSLAESYHIALCYTYNRDESVESFSWLCNAINLQYDYSVLSAIHLMQKYRKKYAQSSEMMIGKVRESDKQVQFRVLHLSLSIARKFFFSRHHRYNPRRGLGQLSFSRPSPISCCVFPAERVYFLRKITTCPDKNRGYRDDTLNTERSLRIFELLCLRAL